MHCMTYMHCNGVSRARIMYCMHHIMHAHDQPCNATLFWEETSMRERKRSKHVLNTSFVLSRTCFLLHLKLRKHVFRRLASKQLIAIQTNAHRYSCCTCVFTSSRCVQCISLDCTLVKYYFNVTILPTASLTINSIFKC